jgi:serine/threonine protein kinase
MALSAGDRLGPYEIVEPLGTGGMGEVHRARDTKLDRDVALKVLPEAFTSDADRLARFEREAKLLASLNHPNIAHVYGFESAALDGGVPVHFLAMELVEGEDLAERLKRGPVPVDEALAVAKQIAGALEEAHERGIVHRDLKPANIKLTPDGKVKVLDFGLAKAGTADSATGSAPDLSQSPTLAHTGTQAGVISSFPPGFPVDQVPSRPVGLEHRSCGFPASKGRAPREALHRPPRSSWPSRSVVSNVVRTPAGPPLAMSRRG